MKQWMYAVVWGFCLAALLVGFPRTARSGEKVALAFKHPMGQTARYKHVYSISYYSDRAELILLTGARTGTVQVDIDGEWQTRETVSPLQAEPGETIAEGTVGVKVRIEKADSRALFMKERLTYEQFPFTMDMLNGREFWLHISPEGKPVRLVPDFKSYTLERQDMITDLRQLYLPEVYPALPEGPVGKNDTWTGEMDFEWPFAKPELMEHKAQVRLSSTYKVKKIQEKKGRTVVTVEEDRTVHYKGWLHVELVSLLVEGKGVGSGEWVIDATRGLVLSHEITMDVDRPTVTIAGAREPLADIRAEYKVALRRKLDKIEKE